MRKVLKGLLTILWATAWIVIVMLFFFFHCITVAFMWIEASLGKLLEGIEDWVQSYWDYI